MFFFLPGGMERLQLAGPAESSSSTTTTRSSSAFGGESFVSLSGDVILPPDAAPAAAGHHPSSYYDPASIMAGDLITMVQHQDGVPPDLNGSSSDYSWMKDKKTVRKNNHNCNYNSLFL